MKIVLIGFMGSGKTAVAEQLGNKLDIDTIEMDAIVLERNKIKDMEELFKKGGEILLREWEIKLAKEWSKLENAIISTGGGVVLNKIILDYLRKPRGSVIFLDVPFKVIQKRVGVDKTARPLFTDVKAAFELFKHRLPLYKKYADIIIKAHAKEPQEIALEIIKKLS